MLGGRYLLLKRIGAGGMGEVWLATDTSLRREVAIKLTTVGDPGQALREAVIGAGLRHPNIVTVYDVLTDGDDQLLVSEYFPARSLAEVLDGGGVLPARQVAGIGARIADALAAMHTKGMVHRDIKPGNVLLAEDGSVKLADLGIATWQALTVDDAHRSCGTPGFIAPEVDGGAVATAKSDVFALGVTLFAAVEGVPYQPPAKPARAGKLAPELLALLAADPAQRPTAATVRDRLLAVAGGPRYTRALLLAAGAALVLGVGAWALLPERGGLAPAPTLAAKSSSTTAAPPVAAASPVAGNWLEEPPVESGQTTLVISANGKIGLTGGSSDCTGEVTGALSPGLHQVLLNCGDGPVEAKLHQDNERHLRLLWSATEADDYTRAPGG